MSGTLPGGKSGAQVAAGLVPAALRLIGQEVVATGLEAAAGAGRRGSVKRFVRGSTKQLTTQGGHEFRDVGEADRSAVEDLVARILVRVASDESFAGRQALQAAAVAGPPALNTLLSKDPPTEIRGLSQDARAYFDVLLRIVAGAICEWYTSDRDAAQSAGLAAQGATLRELEAIAERATLQEALLKEVLAELVLMRSRLTDRGQTHRGAALIGAAQAVAQLDPEDLGVHPAITEYGVTGPTPYLARPHDDRLRGLLANVATSGPVVIMVVGASCTGKTRSLYEAVKCELPAWPVIEPARGTRQVLDVLDAGIPEHHILWLDELQDYVDFSNEGVQTAKRLLELIHQPGAPAIAIVTTVWPSTLTTLMQRPDAERAAAGLSPVHRLLEETEDQQCFVPDAFTDDETTQADRTDPRIALATDTGRGRITQVLGGGMPLLEKYTSTSRSGFSPAAKAVLHTVMDLVRVGYPNPPPLWAIEGAAPGYLPREEYPTVAKDWVSAGLAEAVEPVRGVAALAPEAEAPAVISAYRLHEYLLQHHLTHDNRQPTKAALWDTLTSEVAVQRTPPNVRVRLASNALARGLFPVAIALATPGADSGDLAAAQALAQSIARRGDAETLMSRALRGDWVSMDWLTAELVRKGDLDGLRTLAGATRNTDRPREELARLLAERGDAAELRSRADSGDPHARRRLVELLADRHDTAELIARANEGDELAGAMLTEGDWRDGLRDLAESELPIGGILYAAELADQGQVEELRARAKDGDSAAQQVLDVIARRGTPEHLADLQNDADAGDPMAREALAEILAQQERLPDLRTRATQGDLPAQRHLATELARLRTQDSINELQQCVHATYDGAATRLLSIYRSDSGATVMDLDVNAQPVTSATR